MEISNFGMEVSRAIFQTSTSMKMNIWALAIWQPLSQTGQMIEPLCET